MRNPFPHHESISYAAPPFSMVLIGLLFLFPANLYSMRRIGANKVFFNKILRRKNPIQIDSCKWASYPALQRGMRYGANVSCARDPRKTLVCRERCWQSGPASCWPWKVILANAKEGCGGLANFVIGYFSG